MQAGVLGHEDDAHAPLAENFQDAVMRQPAHFAGALRGIEEIEGFIGIAVRLAFRQRRGGRPLVPLDLPADGLGLGLSLMNRSFARAYIGGSNSCYSAAVQGAMREGSGCAD